MHYIEGKCVYQEGARGQCLPEKFHMNTQTDTQIKCLFCNELFTPPRPWSKFCGTKCRNNYHNDARLRKEGDESVPTVKCIYCKTDEFRMFERIAEHPTGTIYFCNVCSREFIHKD